MKSVLIIGAGKIGSSAAKLLHQSGGYHVTVADRDEAALQRLAAHSPVRALHLNLRNARQLASAIHGQQAVLSATSFDINPVIARACLEQGVSYFDLTEDVSTTRKIRALAKQAKPGQIFMPQCGLAPGFIGILAHDISRRFDKLDSVHMRVGALPQYPSNHMKYNLTWSTDGLINEYCNPCEAIHHGQKIEVLPLEGLEHFALDGLEYEAFNTSGGLGTLCETLTGQVRDMNYKTVRYVGHQYLMDFVINGLRMGSDKNRRKQLKEILESSIPITRQDVVLVFVTVSGWIRGEFQQLTDARKIYHQDISGEHWSAIQLTTAAGVCAAIDLHFHQQLPNHGFVKQEAVNLNDFLNNRFGRYFAIGQHAEEVLP